MNTKQPTPREPSGSGKQWLWFFGLWISGVVTIGTVSLVLRSILLP